MKFEGAIFDVDGTLVDSNDAHAAAFVEAFGEFGFGVAFDEVRQRIGEGADRLIPQIIGRHDEALAQRKRAIFMMRYLPTVRAFPGVDLLLEKLRALGLRLAVASSAARDELGALLEVAHVTAYFTQVVDGDHAAGSKPAPDAVLAAVRMLGLAAERCVMVGDTPYDAAAARRAGTAFVGLRCGGWADRDLQPAIGVYQDPADLLEGLVTGRGCAPRTPS